MTAAMNAANERANEIFRQETISVKHGRGCDITFVRVFNSSFSDDGQIRVDTVACLLFHVVRVFLVPIGCCSQSLTPPSRLRPLRP